MYTPWQKDKEKSKIRNITNFRLPSTTVGNKQRDERITNMPKEDGTQDPGNNKKRQISQQDAVINNRYRGKSHQTEVKMGRPHREDAEWQLDIQVHNVGRTL